MKNTFKYIAAFAVALMSGVSLSAQNLDEGTYKEENGIAYAKRAVLNNNGTYTINLESFVTGEVTQSFESTPADIVLVLDVSASMDEEINEYVYTAYTNSLKAGWRNWPNNNVKDTNPVLYYNYNGEYYQVYIGRSGTMMNRNYFLFFTINGVRYHITTSGSVQTKEPANNASYDTNLNTSNVNLYRRTTQSSGTTKIQALKSAVRAFMTQINKNDIVDPQTKEVRSERLGNRIAIVAFSGAGTLGNSNHDNSIQLNTDWKKLGNTTADSTGLVSLKTDLSNLSTSGGTHVEYGMQDALALIQNSEAQIRTVVLFTDGVPGAGSWDGEGHEWNANQYIQETVKSANDAIDYSRQINAITIGSGDNATTPKIYAVGLFDSKPKEGENTYTYMNYVSSNYPDAANMTTGKTQKSTDFYLDASGGSAEDLKNIFIAIAKASGGSGNTQVGGGSSVTVDIVSSSFSVPKGYDQNPGGAVTVLVAPCIGKTKIGDKDYLTFGPAKTPTEYGLPAINPSISSSDNKVSTTGFEYSANWCGPDETSTSTIQPGYHGFKQIIQFVITVNDDAVGGPSVETNDPDSGIYLPDATEPLIKFNRPNVPIPVQIWIQKQGLQGDDSAVFTIRRIPYRGTYELDENGDYKIGTDGNPIRIKYEDIPKKDWDTFTKVVVNSKDLDANGMVKIVGLDPNYVYKIEEDAWAFGYTYQEGGSQYTIGENIENPFRFINKPDNKKFDEATARNVFKEKTSSK